MASTRFSQGIDVARVGACFMVVVLHVAAVEFHAFDKRWWASNFYDSFTRACVPIFLMITGVLLLDRHEQLTVFFRKRLLRVVPPLVFWSLFYAVWYHLRGQHEAGFANEVLGLFSAPDAYHLWYLYAILGIYVFVPFLRRLWQACTLAEKRLFLFAWVVVSSWPIAQTVLGVHSDLLNLYELHAFFGLTGYLFLGAYVYEHLAARTPTRGYWLSTSVLFLIFSIATMSATWIYSRAQGQPDALFYDYLSPFVIGAAVCAFSLFFSVGAHASRLVGFVRARWHYVSGLAASTLGIYCLHIFVLDLARMVYDTPGRAGSPWWTIPLGAGFVFLSTWLLVRLLRQFRVMHYVM